MQENQFAVGRSEESVLASNKVIRNTYMLLSMTVLFSGAVASIAMAMNAPMMGFWTYLIGLFGLFYAVNKAANSVWGLPLVFALTGFLGYNLGPILNIYLGMANGDFIVTGALGTTAVIFFSLSGYALTSRKDFSFMGGFLFVGLIVIILASIAGMFFHVPGMHLAISSAAVLIFSGYILYDTSRIIHGGETNYIRATVQLYMNIYLLFIHLLNLFSALSGND